MPLSLLAHTSLITLTTGLIYTWTHHSNLAPYNLQLAAVIALIYFLSRLLKPNSYFASLVTTSAFSAIVLLLVFSTGSLNSPFFFLLDLLLFTLALFFEPAQAGFTSLMLIIVFTLDSQLNLSTSDIINLASLVIITPLAIIFGNKYLENLTAQGKIQSLTDQLATEETDALLWLATKAKPSLTQILDTTSQIVASNLLPFRLQEKIKKAHKDLMALHQSASQLEIIIQEDQS